MSQQSNEFPEEYFDEEFDEDDGYLFADLEREEEIWKWENEQGQKQIEEMQYRRIINELDGIDPMIVELNNDIEKIIIESLNGDLNLIEAYANDQEQIENEDDCYLCGGVNFVHPPEYDYENYESVICPECGGQDWKRIK